MKKIITIILAAAALAVSLPGAAHAWSPPGNVVIDGTVTNGGTPVPATQVAVNCKGQFSANFIGIVTTDSKGFYTINTTTRLCWIGATVEVRADQDGDGKFESSAVGPITTPHTTVNIEMGRNIAVPEFGWASGALAAGVGLGAILLVRKRGVAHGQ